MIHIRIFTIRYDIKVFFILFSTKKLRRSTRIEALRTVTAHKSKMLRTKGGKARKALAEAKRSVLLMERSG